MHLAPSLRVAGPSQVVIERWIRYYNEERPHQALGYVAPRAHPALVA
ncbi:hypothetical protein E0702_15330 [Halomonas marinisediminis]|uniref:Integrase catalytic domain-containing protein n=1 Tax=Halomonas marinisediminis TaxID=2546095 RepID=A0ABY2D3L3_9GAMM|nr:hypothetical protein E0702_15330 [Halomonas marinisediminis]